MQSQGVALVVVLWLIVLLSVMVAGHSRNARTDTLLAARQLGSAESRGIAEAGINHVILEMLGRDDVRHTVDGTLFESRVLNDVVVVAVRDVTGLIDLNTASPVLLDAALRACAVDEDQRLRLVDAILDWRDRDDISRPDGFEDDDYVAEGAPWTSRDGDFASIDELRYLPGMSQRLFDQLAPLVTVHSGRSGLNLEFAPPVLITALTGEEVRTASPDSDDSAAVRAGGNGTYRIYASAKVGRGASASIEAVVRVSQSSSQPVIFLEWRDPSRTEFPPGKGVDG